MKTNVLDNQFNFISEWSTVEAKYFLRRLIEGFKENKREIHLLFIDLEKDNDRIHKKLI